MLYSDAHPDPLPDKAVATYQKLLAIDPKNVQALNNLACVLADDYQPPRVEEGMTYVRQAMAILGQRGTSDPLVDDTYGWLLILSGRNTEGVDVLHRVVDRMPIVDGYYHLAEGYLRMNNPAEAQRQVNLALEAIAKAQQTSQPVDSKMRARVVALSSRVLDSLRLRTSGSVP
jgi:tetratricopeptide (TPR) repeat protein